MCQNTGAPKNINFPFGTNGKLMVLGVPILMHFRIHILNKTLVFKRCPFQSSTSLMSILNIFLSKKKICLEFGINIDKSVP